MTVPTADTTGRQEVTVVLATKVWLILSGLATQALLARLLAPEGRGSFAVCVMFGTMFGVLFAPGTDRATQYFVMAGKHSVSRGVWIAVILTAVGCALATAIAIPLIESPLAFFGQAPSSAYYLALPLMPLTVLSISLDLQLAGLRRFSRLALFSVLTSAANLLAIVGFVWGLGWGVGGAVLALAASYSTSVVLSLADLRTHAGLRFERPTAADFRDVLDYGRKYYVARVGSMIDLQVGALFLAMIAAPAEIGLFSAACAMILRAFLISESIESSLLPRVAADPGGRPDLAGQCVRISAFITGGALLVLVVAADPLVRILLSEAFLPVVPLLWILAPGVLLYGASKILMAYFRGQNEPAICSWVVWVGLSVNVVMLLVLYPVLGFVAAAWAMSAGFAVRSIVLAVAFRRRSGQSFGSTWLPRSDDVSLLWSSGRQMLGRFVPTGGSASDA